MCNPPDAASPKFTQHLQKACKNIPAIVSKDQETTLTATQCKPTPANGFSHWHLHVHPPPRLLASMPCIMPTTAGSSVPLSHTNQCRTHPQPKPLPAQCGRNLPRSPSPSPPLLPPAPLEPKLPQLPAAISGCTPSVTKAPWLLPRAPTKADSNPPLLLNRGLPVSQLELRRTGAPSHALLR